MFLHQGGSYLSFFFHMFQQHSNWSSHFVLQVPWWFFSICCLSSHALSSFLSNQGSGPGCCQISVVAWLYPLRLSLPFCPSDLRFWLLDFGLRYRIQAWHWKAWHWKAWHWKAWHLKAWHWKAWHLLVWHFDLTLFGQFHISTLSWQSITCSVGAGYHHLSDLIWFELQHRDRKSVV